MSRNGTLRGKKGSWREMEKLGRIFEREGRKRGKLNERVVIGEILSELQREELVLKFERNWGLDRVGIDWLIFLMNKEIVATQVKSSPRGAKEHYKKYGSYVRFKNQDIRCLVLVINTEHLIDRSDLKKDIKNFFENK